MSKRVLVTGAGGFIGTHVVRELLERGYAVRGTVRDPTDDTKNGHLTKMGDVEVVAGDLMKPGSFDDAAKGCDVVVHTASAVFFNAKDPQKEIVDVAVHGTKNVIEAVQKSGTVSRVVQTSSIAAIGDMNRSDDHLNTEADWCESATVDTDPYALSKVRAEQCAVEMCKAAPEGQRFELTSVHPGFVLGPIAARVHMRSSPSLIRDLMTGKFPMAPQLNFGCVDVREVAKAHVDLVEKPDPKPRHILVSRSASLIDFARALRDRYPSSKAPKRVMPKFMMYGVALFDKRVSFAFLRDNLGRVREFDGSLATRELSITYRPLEESVVDTAESMKTLGFLN